MSAAARRQQLVRLMRRGQQTTAEALAEELGVSRRTVFRDLAQLRDDGFGIDADGGRGGGVRLDPRTMLVAPQLTAEEVVALSLSVAMLRAAPWMPFAREAELALTKIENSLPPARVRQLRRVLRHVLVGQPLESDNSVTANEVDKKLLGVFEECFSGRHPLGFHYVDRHGRKTKRQIEPHALLVRPPVWYIIGWDPEKAALRLFRMDRVRSPRCRDDVQFLQRPLSLALGVCPDASALKTR